MKSYWTVPYFGISHLTKERGNPRTASIARFSHFTTLTCWHERPDNVESGTSGYGFSPDQFNFYGPDRDQKAKKAGEEWMKDAKKPTAKVV